MRLPTVGQTCGGEKEVWVSRWSKNWTRGRWAGRAGGIYVGAMRYSETAIPPATRRWLRCVVRRLRRLNIECLPD